MTAPTDNRARSPVRGLVGVSIVALLALVFVALGGPRPPLPSGGDDGSKPASSSSAAAQRDFVSLATLRRHFTSSDAARYDGQRMIGYVVWTRGGETDFNTDIDVRRVVNGDGSDMRREDGSIILLRRGYSAWYYIEPYDGYSTVKIITTLKAGKPDAVLHGALFVTGNDAYIDLAVGLRRVTNVTPDGFQMTPPGG